MKLFLILALVPGLLILPLQQASASVTIDQTWQSDFYGPSWGVETVVKCPDGHAVVGLAGKDAESWVSAGLKFYCQPISTITEIGNGTETEVLIKESTYWWWAGWSTRVNCSAGSVASGLRIQQAFDNYANYLINAGLICKNYQEQNLETSTSFYGQYFDLETSVACPVNYWLIGVSIKQGWGLDGLRAICASFKNLSSVTIASSAGAGGTISPLGNSSVQLGTSRTYSITPSPKYEISNVKVDGSSVGILSSFTFTNVQVAHTIEATFIPFKGNKQSTSGSCSSSSSIANSKSNGQGAVNNAATFCLATLGPKN